MTADSDLQKHGPVCTMHGPFARDERAFVQRCPACLEADKALRLAGEEQRLRNAKASALKNCGVAVRYQGLTFDDFRADTETKAGVLAVAKRIVDGWDEVIESGESFVLSGRPGTGKTHIAATVAQALIEEKGVLRVRYVSALDLIRMVRETWRRDSECSEIEFLDRMASYDLLVIDEVGVQYGTDAEKITTFDVINRRYQNVVPTIVVTNLNKSGLKEFVGDRTFDRLRDPGTWVSFDWASERGKK